MPVIYGWTEAHAAAGHAVAILREGGCLRCGFGRTGVPGFQVVEWLNDAGTTLEEPACGAHYQPYGPIELGFVTSLIAQFALECLLGKVTLSSQRIYAARHPFIEELGGRWSDSWVREYPAQINGGVIVDREWPCSPCGGCRSQQRQLAHPRLADSGAV